MRVAFAADHAGARLKDELIAKLAGLTGGAHELIDLGGDGSDPQDDYPDFAQRLGLAIQEGRADRGILICGSGVGASVAANKMRGVRTAVCHDTYSAHQGVEHDDMNVLTLGARVIGIEPAAECSLAFLGATFSAEPRHVRRLAKVLAIEAESMGDVEPPRRNAGGLTGRNLPPAVLGADRNRALGGRSDAIRDTVRRADPRQGSLTTGRPEGGCQLRCHARRSLPREAPSIDTGRGADE